MKKFMNMYILTIFIVLITTGNCRKQKQPASSALRYQVSRLTRTTEGLQKDVSDIWDLLSKRDVVSTFGENETEQVCSLDDKGFKLFLNQSVSDVETLKTEMESLKIQSRKGFTSEKKIMRKETERLKKSTLQLQNGVNEQMTDFMKTERNELREEKLQLQNIVKEQITDLQNKSEANQAQLQMQLKSIKAELKSKLEEIDALKMTLNQTGDYLSNKLEDFEERFTSKMVNLIVSVDSSEADQFLCEEGWTYFKSHCYLIKNSVVPHYIIASGRCQRLNARLIEIESDEEMEFITSKYTVTDTTVAGPDSIIVGASREAQEGYFVWKHSQKQIPQRYWGPGEPEPFKTGVALDIKEKVLYTVGRLYPWQKKWSFACEKPYNFGDSGKLIWYKICIYPYRETSVFTGNIGTGSESKQCRTRSDAA